MYKLVEISIPPPGAYDQRAQRMEDLARCPMGWLVTEGPRCMDAVGKLG